MATFETKGAQYDFMRARRLRIARMSTGLNISQAAAILEMPILRYALLENGETEFVRPEHWEEAEAALRESRTGTRPPPAT